MRCVVALNYSSPASAHLLNLRAALKLNWESMAKAKRKWDWGLRDILQ